MAWKVGFLPVSSHLDHQSLRLRSQNKPHYWSQVMVKKKSGFPVQPEEKIRKNRVFWSTYRESSYHTIDNSVVRHIPHFFQPHARTCSRIFSWQGNSSITKCMGELSLKSRFSCHPNEYVKTGNKCTTFKRSCCQSGKVFTTKKQTKLPWKNPHR